jgi:hypothetical protein
LSSNPNDSGFISPPVRTDRPNAAIKRRRSTSVSISMSCPKSCESSERLPSSDDDGANDPALPDAFASRQEDFATARAGRCRHCCGSVPAASSAAGDKPLHRTLCGRSWSRGPSDLLHTNRGRQHATLSLSPKQGGPHVAARQQDQRELTQAELSEVTAAWCAAGTRQCRQLCGLRRAFCPELPMGHSSAGDDRLKRAWLAGWISGFLHSCHYADPQRQHRRS